MKQLLKIEPGKPFRIKGFDPGYTHGLDKSQAEEAAPSILSRLSNLHELLFADGKHSLLVVFQAMDTGGKDGAVKHLSRGLDLQWVHTVSFKAPTPEELAHDFLWRIHPHVPRRGQVSIFVRSHYEDVLIVRVKGLVPKEVWEARYARINEFERQLAESGTILLKFFLHISKEEQAERLRARRDDPTKVGWKFNPEDLKERERWDDYMKAYEDAIANCSTSYAPWFVIPSDHKWYRNLAVSNVIADTLAGLGLEYPPPPPGVRELVIS